MSQEAPYPYDSFEVSLRLGNEAMQSPEDVTDALRRVAQMMENGGYEGSVLDNNGNAVGSYRWIKSEPGAVCPPHEGMGRAR